MNTPSANRVRWKMLPSRIVASAAVAAMALCLPLPSFAGWVAGPPLQTARDQFAGGVLNGKFIVFGGNGNPNGENLKSTEALDPVLGAWTYLADNKDNGGQGVEELTGAVVNDKFYAFGAWGGGTPYGVMNFVEKYDPLSNTWTPKAPMPTTRASATAVVYKNKIYVFGGYYAYENNGNDAGRTNYDVVEAYDPASNSWTTETHLPKRVGSSAIAVIGDNAYVIGGYTGNPEAGTAKLKSDVSVYNFLTHTWSVSGHAALPNPRVFSYSSAAPVMGGRIYLVGGIEGTSQANVRPSSRVDIYDPAANTWVSGDPLPNGTVGGYSAIVSNDLWVIGGNNSLSTENHCLATVWKHSLADITNILTIAGMVTRSDTKRPLPGATITFSGGLGTLTTDSSGNYSNLVPVGWNGTVTVSFCSGGFAKSNLTYKALKVNQTKQNFLWSPDPVISGKVTDKATKSGVAGVTVAFSGGIGPALTDTNGNYRQTVPYGWSGSATASNGIAGSFSPASRNFSKLTADSKGQDFTWTYLLSFNMADYWPMPAGAHWLYEGTDYDGIPSYLSLDVANTNYSLDVYSGSKPVTTYHTNCVRIAAAYLDHNTRAAYDTWDEFRGTGARMVWYGDDDLPDESFRGGTGLPFPVRMALGEKFTLRVNGYSFGTNAGPFTFGFQVLDFGPLHVPAGTFTNVLHVRYSLVSIGGSEVKDEWWAEGIGTIKKQGISGNGKNTSVELVSFSNLPSASAVALPQSAIPASRSRSSTAQPTVAAVLPSAFLLHTTGTVLWPGKDAATIQSASDPLTILVADGQAKAVLPAPAPMAAAIDFEPPDGGAAVAAAQSPVLIEVHNVGGRLVPVASPGTVVDGHVALLPSGDAVQLVWDLTLLAR